MGAAPLEAVLGPLRAGVSFGMRILRLKPPAVAASRMFEVNPQKLLQRSNPGLTRLVCSPQSPSDDEQGRR